MTVVTEPIVANGNGKADDVANHVFPLESFRDAAVFLRRPFTAAAVKFKVQTSWPKDNPHTALIVGYIDARLVIERLNLVCPHLWHDEYEPAGNLLRCHLTVDGITRTDVGEGTGKGLYSGALKRAAVKFGVGVSLYALPRMLLRVQDQDVHVKTVKGEKSLAITDKGEATLRALYEEWLDEHGAKHFGPALDHGDVVGAVGDHEAQEEDTDTEPEVEDQPKAITKARAAELVKAAALAGMSGARVALAVSAQTGEDPGVLDTQSKAVDALRVLTTEQADEIQAWIDSHTESANA